MRAASFQARVSRAASGRTDWLGLGGGWPSARVPGQERMPAQPSKRTAHTAANLKERGRNARQSGANLGPREASTPEGDSGGPATQQGACSSRHSKGHAARGTGSPTWLPSGCALQGETGGALRRGRCRVGAPGWQVLRADMERSTI